MVFFPCSDWKMVLACSSCTRPSGSTAGAEGQVTWEQSPTKYLSVSENRASCPGRWACRHWGCTRGGRKPLLQACTWGLARSTANGPS